jgi:hypothetical protein
MVVVLNTCSVAAQRVVPSRRATPRLLKKREEENKQKPTSKPSKTWSTTDSLARRKTSSRLSH